MSSVKKAAGDKVGQFYESVLDATKPSSESGEKVTAKELKTATAKLQGASDAEKQRALADTVEYLGDKLAAGARKEVAGDAAQAPVREANVLAQKAALKMLLEGPVIDKAHTQAHQVSALQEGIIAAVRGQVDAAADGGKGRDLLVALVRDTTDAATLSVLRSAWPHLLDEGGTLDAELVGKFATTMKIASASLDQAREKSLNKLFEKFVGKADATEAEAPVERPTTIGGKDEATVAKEVDGLDRAQGMGRFVLDPERIRVDAYRKAVAAIRGNDSIKQLLPAVERSARRQEEQSLASQAIGEGLVLDASSPKTYFHGINKGAYDLVQETAQEMGFTKEVTTVIEPSLMPNAYVYTADMERPRVTIHTALIEKLWNNTKGDWISISVDADGKPTEPGAKGSHEYPVGKLIAQSVIAHELGHIRDAITINEALLIMVMEQAGVDLLGEVDKASTSKDGKALRDSLSSRYGEGIALGVARDPQLKGAISKRQAQKTLQAIFPGSREMLAAAEAGEEEANATLQQFMQRFYRFGRAAESTADRYAVALQGDPKPTQLTDLMLNTDYTVGTDEDKTRRLRELVALDPEAWAEDKINRSARYSDDDAVALTAGISHPHGPVRIADVGAFAREDAAYFLELQGLRELPAGERLVANMQILEQAIGQRETRIEDLRPQDQWDSESGLREESRLKSEVQGLEAKLNAYQSYFGSLLEADGLGAAKGAYIDQVLDFIEAGGSTFTQDLELSPGPGGDSAEIRTGDFPHVLTQLGELLEKAKDGADEQAAARIEARMARVEKLTTAIETRAEERAQKSALQQLVSERMGRLAAE